LSTAKGWLGVKILGALKIFCEKTTLPDKTKKDCGALLEIWLFSYFCHPRVSPPFLTTLMLFTCLRTNVLTEKSASLFIMPT